MLLLGIALSLTWMLAGRSWRIGAVVGGSDSAMLGGGFYTKEITGEGVPFRWTTGPALVNVPWVRSLYLVALRMDTATGEPYQVELMEHSNRVAVFEAQPGFRTYYVLWPSEVKRRWFEGFGSRELTISAQERPLAPNDDRLFGIAVGGVRVQEMARGTAPVAPLLAVGLAAGSLAALLQPLGKARLLALAGAALALPIAYDLLAWHPPVGNDYTWLPIGWLPWFVALALTGLLLARVAAGSARGAVFVAAATGMLLLGFLLTLGPQWRVEGPDFGWHLNRGGSWERVFRAHGFYPFGFPLVLWLGQLAGDRPLAFGLASGLISTLVSFGAVVLLAWRLLGREHAWMAGVLLLCAPVFVAYGMLASTDALMAAPATLALLALCWSPDAHMKHVALGGLALGISYLFRFQAMLLLAPALLWLALAHPIDAPRRLPRLARLGRFTLPLLFLLAFVAGSAPQWILDIRDFGRPFFTRQYVNIWTFAYGRVEGLAPGPPLAELWYIISYDPSTMARHWAANMRDVAANTIHRLFLWPIGLIALAGLVTGPLYLRDRRYLLLGLWAVMYVGAVTLTANKERFFLPAVPALVLFALAALAQLRERLARLGGRWPSLFTAAQVALWCWALANLLAAEAELLANGFAI